MLNYTDVIQDPPYLMGFRRAHLAAFMEMRVRQDGECVVWTGARTPNGYGRFTLRNADKEICAFNAHRVAYELFVGEIPEGWEIDHLCENPPCVRPDHLEALTHEAHVQRTRHRRGLDEVGFAHPPSPKMRAFLKELDARGIKHVRLA